MKIQYRKCLIEVDLPFFEDKFDWNIGIDVLNDIGQNFEETQIKEVGKIVEEIDLE